MPLPDDAPAARVPQSTKAPGSPRRGTTQNAVTSVSEEIKRWIFKGSLRPGDRLPPELELASRLGVSRQSVREGLRSLELTGLLEVRRGGAGGRFIVDTIAASIGNALSDAAQWAKITPEQLTVARIELETSVAKLAALNADETDILFLRKNIEHARTKIERDAPAVEENIAFHRLLASASKNHILATLTEALLRVLAEAVRRPPLTPRTEKSLDFLAAHEGILGAVVNRDPAAAVALMERHLREVTARLAEPPCGVA